MPLDVAALVEPLAVAWHAVKLAELGAGDWALVVGAGMFGTVVPVPCKGKDVVVAC
jgi:(R,R)-butanediol dehydrogenase/meso-butanediol dehydrogenase/diacetyl reductase